MDAIEKYREALVIQRIGLGPRHGDVAVTLQAIAGVFSDICLHQEAVTTLMEAADIQREALGTWMCSLGCCVVLGRWGGDTETLETLGTWGRGDVGRWEVGRWGGGYAVR